MDFLLQKLEAIKEGKVFNPTIRIRPDGTNLGGASVNARQDPWNFQWKV